MAHDLDTYKLDLIKDVDVQQDQSREADNDTRFVNVPGGMWEDFAESTFSKRIKLELNLAKTRVNKYIGQWLNNRIGVVYKSNDEATSDADAELLNGIYRNDFLENSGKTSIDNAVAEVATCGYGAFKLTTFFIDEGDPENDLQGIKHSPIYNAYNTIFWDANAKRSDKRDAERCVELIPFTADAFHGKWPDADFVTAYTPRNFGELDHSRNKPEIIYVAKRYDIVKIEETVHVYGNLKTGKIETYSEEDHELIKDELKKDEFKTFQRKRKIVKQHIETVVFNGAEILEEPTIIAGKWIPIIPMYGFRYYVNGVEWYNGLVRDLKDAARLFVVQVSQLTEDAASGGRRIPVFAPSQMTNPLIKQLWADKNKVPYLLADPLYDNDGKIISAGPIGYDEPGQLDPSTAALMAIVPGFIERVSGGLPQDVTDKNMSGKLFRAIQKREDLTTQGMNNNIIDSITWSGEVYKDMALDGIYTVKRMASTIGLDGTEGRKQLMNHVLDEQTGRIVESNDLTSKKFKVYADVGAQYDTLREETAEDLKGMLDILPNIAGGERYTAPVLSTLFDTINGVGLGPLKKLNRRIMIEQGLIPPETDEEKQQLAATQEAANQPDPQQQLIAAAAKQAEGEGRERESKVLVNAADANKKQAETQKILSDINVSQQDANDSSVKTLADIRNQVFQNTQQGTLQ